MIVPWASSMLSLGFVKGWSPQSCLQGTVPGTPGEAGVGSILLAAGLSGEAGSKGTLGGSGEYQE